MTYILGVDGGNTKTIALVARLDGTIVGAGRAACGDIYATTPEPALEQIKLAVDAALAQAAATRDQIASGCFSLAGADWDEDYAFLKAALEQQGSGAVVSVYNDAIGALRAGSPTGTGVVIACGTGTACGARSADGRFWHTSFWQEAYCGHEMGSRALRAVYRADLGIDPPTALTAPILAHYHQPDVESLLKYFTALGHEHHPAAKIARLSRIVMDEAALGDPAARKIIEDMGRGLADYALAAARKVGIAPDPLVLNGGVFKHGSRVLIDVILKHLRPAAPNVNPILSRHEPAVGALMLAFEQHGIALPPRSEVLANLEASVPGRDLFHT
jgi:N-acetylglucosamine kinase-like BadF-type ATPase